MFALLVCQNSQTMSYLVPHTRYIHIYIIGTCFRKARYAHDLRNCVQARKRSHLCASAVQTSRCIKIAAALAFRILLFARGRRRCGCIMCARNENVDKQQINIASPPQAPSRAHLICKTRVYSTDQTRECVYIRMLRERSLEYGHYIFSFVFCVSKGSNLLFSFSGNKRRAVVLH